MSAGSEDRASAARERLLRWLGEIGPRWGLPADACRAHGWLYLAGRPGSVAEIAAALGLTEPEVVAALDWLEEHELVTRPGPDLWSTFTDPWEMVVRSLEARREQELGPALDILEASRRDAAADPALAARIGRLLALVEDIAAIDAQAQRLSPATLRRLIGAGGRAARLFERAFGQRRGASR